jgi:hypothetical protein
VITPSVEAIVLAYLKEHGYDGLINTGRDCSCSINDLSPCGVLKGWCVAGWRKLGSDYEDDLVTTPPLGVKP